MPASETPSTVNYVRMGEGDPLVLIHGIGHRWQAWEPVLERLAEHHDVIAVDLPGFGESPAPPSGMPSDMSGAVERMRDFMREIDLLGPFGSTRNPHPRPHIAGNSLGGAIALELADAGLAASATALSPAGFFRRGHRVWALTLLRVMRANTFVPIPVMRSALRVRPVRSLTFGPLMTHPDRLSLDRVVGDALALRRASGFRRVARAARRYRFDGAPSVPVTIAWGDHDRVLPPSQARLARVRLPDARHVILHDCGHVPMSDDPDQVTSVILATTRAGLAKPGRT